MKYKYFVTFNWTKAIDMSDEDEKVLEFGRMFVPDMKPPKEFGNCSMMIRISKKLTYRCTTDKSTFL